jgi:hypothetical protein
MATKLAQEFKITEAIITAERFGGEEYDIRAYIMELSCFEDLEKPYVTGQIVFMDDIGLIQEIKILGTEQIKLTVETVEKSIDPVKWTMQFNIVSIVQQEKTAERTEVFHVNIISPHAYRDQNIKISRSYTGRLTKIAEAVMKNHLEVEIDRSYGGDQVEAQDPVRIITPYISPLETVTWLMDRATTDIGCPYYAYQTLYDQEDGVDKIRIGNLEKMMNAKAFNDERHMLFSQSRGMLIAGESQAKQDVIVKRVLVDTIQDTLKLTQEGALGANLTNIDTYTSQKYDRHFDAKKLLDRLGDANVVTGGKENQNVYDIEQKISIEGEEKTLPDCESRFISTIASFGTYGSINSYADDQNQFQAMNKIRSNAIKSLLNKNMIEVTIPGISFFKSKGAGGASLPSVGDVIWIDFLKSNTDDASNGTLNQELSGLYLIHKCRNHYRNTVHEVVMAVTKLAKNETDKTGGSDNGGV